MFSLHLHCSMKIIKRSCPEVFVYDCRTKRKVRVPFYPVASHSKQLFQANSIKFW